MKLILNTFLILTFFSCTKIEDFSAANGANSSEGYRAKTVVSESQLKSYTLQDPQKLVKIGKIISEGKYLLINEYGKGIHVFDNSIPSSPVNKVFISIPGNRDFYLKDLYLLADNGTNFVALNIKLIDEIISNGKTLKDLVDAKKTIEKVGGIDNVFKFPQFPLERNVFFECPDTTKGLIIEWELVKMTQKPNCFR